jgi:hypothetical protein
MTLILTKRIWTRIHVALLEVGVSRGKGSSAIDDKWFEKLGQGTKYIDLMSNKAV